MKAIVSGLVNIETTLKVRDFPIDYYPIDYPFYGIHSDVAGVAYNLSKAFMKLGDEVELFSFLGNDEEGERVLDRLRKEGVAANISRGLDETPASVVLYDESGRRQIYCDLKNIQDKEIDMDSAWLWRLKQCDLAVTCNINFNRALIRKAKELGKVTATDVHVLRDIEDDFNRGFMEYADILFLSDEQLPCEPSAFIKKLKDRYASQTIVIGMGSKGAMLYDRREDKIWQLHAVETGPVVNTVGAGDALFSGFLHYYMRGLPPLEALMRAEVFASIKIGHNGAARGFCDEGEIERVFAEKRPRQEALRL